ncbi:hypothetical protein FA15DRAFT_757331 [Coprinopsis marcescibilis]|uniref:Nephrocystin 3-like N-terminal domain-containing protein n=1 Tax=Coprinopsis marcescibilis TaxID=230819 RepID=A0A5C3KRR8_COPMA|nr:hypothetical protein FA15DRAFT_757331 [Coprinopsis marcescibilis]
MAKLDLAKHEPELALLLSSLAFHLALSQRIEEAIPVLEEAREVSTLCSMARSLYAYTTPGSSTTKLSRGLWRSLKGGLRGQGSAKAGIEIFSKSSHVMLNDVVINAQAVERQEIHYHSADSAAGIKLQEALRRLPDPKRCHWDIMRVCSEGTRIAHLEEISSWATRSVDNNVPSEQAERVLVVGGPAGSGKSALAHTICKRMDDSGLLVASFFFSQMGQQLTSEDFMAVFIRGLCSLNPQIEQRIGRLIVEKPALASSSAIVQFEGLVIPIIPLLSTDRTFVVGIDSLDEQSDKVLLGFLRDYVPRLPVTFKFVLTTRPVPQVMQHLEGQPHIHMFSRLLAGGSSSQDVRTYTQLRLSKTNYCARISPELLDEFVSKCEGLFLWAETVLNHIDGSYNPPAELADIVKGASSHWMESETSTKKLESLYAHILSKLQWTDRRFVEKYNVVMGALVTLMEPLSVRGLAALYAPDGIAEEDIHRICTFIRPLLQDYSRDTPRRPVRLLHLSVQEFLTRNAPPPCYIDLDVHHLFLSRLSLLTIKKELAPTHVPTLGFTEGDWVWDFTEAAPRIPRLSMEVALEHLWYACRHVGEHELSVPKEIANEPHGALLYETVVENPCCLLEASASMGAIVDIVSLRKKALTLRSAVFTLEGIRETMKTYFAMAACLYPQDKSLVLMEEAIRLYRQCAPSRAEPPMELEYAAGLLRLSWLHSARLRSKEGLVVAEEALAITRRLTSTSHNMANPVLGSALLLQSRILHKLRRSAESHEVDLKAIDTFRELEAVQPDIFRVHLATTLHRAGSNLTRRQRHSEAITYIQESTKLRRWLASSNPDRFEGPLASVLLEYGVCLVEVGKATEAVALGEEAVMIQGRLVEKHASYCSPDLAHSLHRLAWHLSQCGRDSDAVPPSKESLEIRRKLAETDPTAYESALSSSLHAHAIYLSKSPTTLAESVAHGQEAMEIRRRLANEDPQSNNADLADSLHNLSNDLADCSRYSEAVKLAKECVDIYRSLAERDPATYEASLADSLHNYAIYLSRSPTRLAESVEPGQEAVEIRRRLVREDPQSFDDLADSLHNLAACLVNCNRHSSAVVVVKESVDIRRRLSEENPAKYEVSLAESLHAYAFCLSKSPTTLEESIEPGQEAVEIRRRLAREDPQRFDAGLADSLYSLSAGLANCNCNSNAVLIVKESVDIRRRLAESDPATYEASLADSLHNYAIYLSRSPTTLAESVEPAQEAVEIRRRLAREDPQGFDAHLVQSIHNLAWCLGRCGRHSDAALTMKESVDTHRKLAETDPATYSVSLASSLQDYAFYLSKSSTTLTESIEPVQEAVKIRRRLACEDPQSFDAGLAESLHKLALRLNSCGRYSEAVPVVKECVDVRRRLAVRNRATYEPLLASALNSHAWYLAHIPGREPEALKPAEESVNIYRRLALEDPKTFLNNLATSLDTMAYSLNNCGRYEDALPPVLEGLEICHQGIEGEAYKISDSTSSILHKTYAESLVGLGRGNEATVTLKSAIIIYRRLLSLEPEDASYSRELQECHQLLERLAGVCSTEI